MKAAMVDRTLVALADATRRGVVELLRDGPLRAGELSSALQVNKSTLTRHLRVLRESALVQEDAVQEDGRVRIYRLQREAFRDLRGWLDEVERCWELQLESFKQHAERSRPRGGTRRVRS